MPVELPHPVMTLNPVPLGQPVVQVMMVLCLALAAATVLTRGKSWQRQVSSWWRLMPAVFLAWWLEPWGVWSLVLLIGGLALRELRLHAAHEAPTLRRLLLANWWLLALIAAFHPALAAFAAATSTLGIWWLYRRRSERLYLLLGLFMAQAAGLWCLPLLAGWPATGEAGASWFFFVCTVTALNDIAQFISGKLWGRHAIARQISPNKTWQGAVGGLMVSVVMSLSVGSALGLADPPALIALGVLLCASGLAGDLLYSAGKRALGIKDYSTLIPGHGGILDRVDSLVLTAPALLMALHLMQAIG